MDWQDTILRVIDLRTFASIWYWVAVIVSWAIACHWLIGVPFDLLVRARKAEGQDMADLEAIVDINVRRFTNVTDVLGLSFVGVVMFFLAATAMAGFYYRLEFAQGLFILGAPLAFITVLNIRLAYQLRAAPLAGAELVNRLFKLRLWTQFVGMVSIFFTAMYGMVYTLELLFVF